ncbi:hypothetical protein V2J09_013689 [Rumex salicifolius]
MSASAMILDPKPIPEAPISVPATLSGPVVLSDQASNDDDLYGCMKSLERQLEFIEIQEEYVKDEQKNLKRELLRAQEEVKRIQSVPLVIGQFMEMIDQNNGIVGSTTGSNYYVRILSTINRELLKPSASVALHRHSNALVDVLPPEADSSISLLSQSEKPDVTYNDIGGSDIQKQEIREAVELPLTHHDLYKQIGIDPPRGVLLYGPPGTGKTMLAKAVAHHTTAAFIRVVGSEFVQKYLGEGPRMVRDVFRLAKENAPAIVFIDEVDAIATARFDAQTGADREVQRILMELLNQMDGFDQTVNVKVIMATNRADTLDPALLRPGRLDRKIEFPLPDRRQKRLVFQVCTAKMNLSDEVDLEDYVSRPDKISAAEIAAICQEAGLHAVRKNRYVILPKDFEKGYRANKPQMTSHLPPTLPLHSSPTTAAPQRVTARDLATHLTSSTSLDQLKQVHAQILRSGFDRSTSLLFKLISSSSSFSNGGLDYALSVFDEIRRPETRQCNGFLRDISRSADPRKTLLAYARIRWGSLRVDRFSFPPLLKAAAKASALVEGMEIHGLLIKLGYWSDPFVQTGLVGMYAALRRVEDARLVFDKMSYRDVVTWNIMLDGYSRSGVYDEAFMLFEEMIKHSGVMPDKIILSTVLSACKRAKNINYGKMIHGFIRENNVVIDSHLHSALITMYADCGHMDMAEDFFEEISSKDVVVSTTMITGYIKDGHIASARSVFDQTVEKDLVFWSVMISGYAKSDSPQEALNLFDQMRSSGIKPDEITMLSVISACAHLGDLKEAYWIHEYVNENRFGSALPVLNAIIDMYAKCGDLERARTVFSSMHRRDVISWTTMINAFAFYGDAANALNCFDQMKTQGVEPNWLTFVALLHACSRAGLVEVGEKIFNSMTDVYNIPPKEEHYGCMVDLFSRAKLVNKALEIIGSMPMPPNVTVWGTLMDACGVHLEVEVGEFAAKKLLELDPGHKGAFGFLSNIRAKQRRLQDANDIVLENDCNGHLATAYVDIESELNHSLTRRVLRFHHHLEPCHLWECRQRCRDRCPERRHAYPTPPVLRRPTPGVVCASGPDRDVTDRPAVEADGVAPGVGDLVSSTWRM